MMTDFNDGSLIPTSYTNKQMNEMAIWAYKRGWEDAQESMHPSDEQLKVFKADLEIAKTE